MAAKENKATFLVNCMVTFFERTRPASNMANPAAIQNTKKPPIKNSRELRIKTLSVGTNAGASCAKTAPGMITAVAAPERILCFVFNILSGPSLYRVSAGFTGAHSDSLIDIENEDFAIPNFACFGCLGDSFNDLIRH